MSINLGIPEKTNELRPRIIVIGVGGGGCNALTTMIKSNLKETWPYGNPHLI